MLQADAKDIGVAIRQFLGKRACACNQYVVAIGMRRGGRERCHAPALSAKQLLVRSLGPGVRQRSANEIAIPCAKDLRSILVRCGLFRKRADQTARKLTSFEGRRTCKGKGVARVD